MKKSTGFGVFCLFVILFFQPATLRSEDESVREKFAPLRSAYTNDGCSVEIISTVSIDKTETKKKKTPVYVYEYAFINRGETEVNISFMSPPYIHLTLGRGEKRKEKFITKAKPKILSARVTVRIRINNKWFLDGLNISIIYTPDV